MNSDYGNNGDKTGGETGKDNGSNCFSSRYYYHYPVGYRFVPTDEELLEEYLDKRRRNQPLPPDFIPDRDVYSHHPKELFENRTYLRDHENYFFTTTVKRYAKGTRPNRTAGQGRWKPTGSDKKFPVSGGRTGYKKSLAYMEGKPQNETKTKWKMHEYIICDGRSKTRTDNEPVLCKIYVKRSKTEQDDDEIEDGERPLAYSTAGTSQVPKPRNHNYEEFVASSAAGTSQVPVPESNHHTSEFNGYLPCNQPLNDNPTLPLVNHFTSSFSPSSSNMGYHRQNMALEMHELCNSGSAGINAMDYQYSGTGANHFDLPPPSRRLYDLRSFEFGIQDYIGFDMGDFYSLEQNYDGGGAGLEWCSCLPADDQQPRTSSMPPPPPAKMEKDLYIADVPNNQIPPNSTHNFPPTNGHDHDEQDFLQDPLKFFA